MIRLRSIIHFNPMQLKWRIRIAIIAWQSSDSTDVASLSHNTLPLLVRGMEESRTIDGL